MIATGTFYEAVDIQQRFIKQLGEIGRDRIGELATLTTLGEFAALVKERLGLQGLRYVGDAGRRVKKVALCGGSGMALFLKQSLDKVQQLCRMILAVKQGQVILDPPLANFMFAGKPDCPFLKQLTARELEILSLLSQGYTNQQIAETLFIDIKTVEHHLNSMYSKLKSDPDYNAKHLRVSAARLYLEKMGVLQPKEESRIPAGVR